MISDVAVVMPEDEEPTNGNPGKVAPPLNEEGSTSETGNVEQATLFDSENSGSPKKAENKKQDQPPKPEAKKTTESKRTTPKAKPKNLPQKRKSKKK
jgi:hypothetical protein